MFQTKPSMFVLCRKKWMHQLDREMLGDTMQTRCAPNLWNLEFRVAACNCSIKASLMCYYNFNPSEKGSLRAH